MSKTEKTLERLVSCGKRSCPNVGDYAEQLRQLALVKADREEARKRGKFFKALGDETRQRMLGLLIERDMCVCEMMTALRMTQPTTSHHLRILEDVGLVHRIKDGKWVFYEVLNKQRVSELIQRAAE